MTFPTRHRIWQPLVDAGLVALAWYLAFQLRFDDGVPVYYDTLFRRTILIVVAIKIAVFILFGIYNHWWRYVSMRDMWRIARAVVAGSVIAYVTVYFLSPVAEIRLPRSIACSTCCSRSRSWPQPLLVHRDRAARPGGPRRARQRRC